MTIYSKRQRDLMLVPVVARVERNLQRLRQRSVDEVEAELELELDTSAMVADQDERRRLVLRQALRGVTLHGWSAAISDDGCRVHLVGGLMTIDLGLSPAIAQYIREGVNSSAVAAYAV